MRYDAEVRNRILREYCLSGATQEAFCARSGVPSRTLRAWLAESRPGSLQGRAIEVVARAISDLEQIRNMLEAAGGGRPGADTCDGGPEPDEFCAERQQGSAAKKVENADLVDQLAKNCPLANEGERQVRAAPSPKGRRKRSYFADLD